jgi:hypothetical protein
VDGFGEIQINAERERAMPRLRYEILSILNRDANEEAKMARG